MTSTAVNALGNTEVKTPNVDRLVDTVTTGEIKYAFTQFQCSELR
ncbi:MAG: hypothetical protein WBM98_10035 [Maribacter sp.]